MLRGVCPDEVCRCALQFDAREPSVCCCHCGQVHLPEDIRSAPLVEGSSVLALLLLYKQHLTAATNKGPDMVKVLGLSNYHQKLLSPLLTHYGMDKRTSKAKPLHELTKRDTLDCGVFGDRSFSIERRHLHIVGYGRDQSGSAAYLADTLAMLAPYNYDNKEALIRVHADGDGHCLVHAVSRALVGRQLFWHPLRAALKLHITQHLAQYKTLLGDFINVSEWPYIIAECDPDYLPPDGDILGLRTVHVFGLANVLRRPILLLDSLAGMNTSAEYSAMFLPGLSDPQLCRNKAGRLNPTLCLAWSSLARNHYIPLVPIRDSRLPRVPRHLLPKVWAFPQTLLDTYIEFDEADCLTIGGHNCLSDTYILTLCSAMDELFTAKHGVPPALVSEYFQYHYSLKPGNVVMKSSQSRVIEEAHNALHERRMMRCLICAALCVTPFAAEWLRPGGLLYRLIERKVGRLREGSIYPFPEYGVKCVYNQKKNSLILISTKPMERCSFCCGSKLRSIRPDGSVAYDNGDTTLTPVTDPLTNKCPCGFKHWFHGQEYDNPPRMVTVVLVWGHQIVTDKIEWFEDEANRYLNSNAYMIAQCLLQKHFPGEFGSERLLKMIVDQILEQTKILPPERNYHLKEANKEGEEARGGELSTKQASTVVCSLQVEASPRSGLTLSSCTGATASIEPPVCEPKAVSSIMPPVCEPKAVSSIMPPVCEPKAVSSIMPPVCEPKAVSSIMPPGASTAGDGDSMAGNASGEPNKRPKWTRTGPGYMTLSDDTLSTQRPTENLAAMAQFMAAVNKNNPRPSTSKE